MGKKKWSMKKVFSLVASLLMIISLLAPEIASAEPTSEMYRSLKDSQSTPEVKMSEHLQKEFDDEELVTFLVKFVEKADPMLVAEEANKNSQLNNMSAEKSKLYQRSAVIANLKSVATESQQNVVEFLEKEMAKGNVEEFESFHIVNGMAVTATKEIAEKIAEFKEVEKLLPNEIRQLNETIITDEEAPQSKLENVEWSIERVNAPQAWAMGIDGSGTVVASIDTGVQWDHPALKDKYRGYTKGTGSVNHTYSWFDATLRRAVPYDDHGHGTHVTGTMVGSEPNGTNKIGVAPAAKWIAVRAFTERGGTDYDLLAAAQWILAPGGRVDMAPDVVNNSWSGGRGLDEWYRDVVKAWRAAEIFPEFSAGNTSQSNPGGPGSVAAPANYPESFATGAVDINNRVANFSLRGPSPYGEVKPDIIAPGVSIRSSVPGGRYEGGWNGTSMSGPAVSGVAALLRQAKPNISVSEMEEILISTATPLIDQNYPVSPNNGYGYGLVNAYKAVINASTKKVTVSGKITSGQTSVGIKGASIQLGDSSISPVKTNSEGKYSISAYPGTYTLKVIADGFHSKEVEVKIGEKPIVVNVILQPFETIPGKELKYDDGSAENAFVYYEKGNGWAVKMSLPTGKKSAIVTDGVFRFWGKEWPNPGGTAFAVEVWDASGINGKPGKKLAGPINATALRNGNWTVVDLRNNNIVVDGDFYMVYIQTQPDPYAPGLAVDDNSSNANRSYEFSPGSGFSPAPRADGNFMIRARVAYENPVTRISGNDRYLTSLKISQDGWEKSNTVVLAQGNGFADALAGVPLAQKLGAPVLLTLKDRLYPETLNEIKRLDAKNVIVLGGPAAVSDSVTNALQKEGLKVERIAGTDRFETAAEIALKVAPTGVGKAVVVNGLDFPDALSVASHAAKQGLPILLTQKKILPKATKDAMDSLGVSQTIVVGGTTVVTDKVKDSLPRATRLGGKDRYETNVDVANYFGDQNKYVYVATGKTYADALTGAVLAAKKDSAVILVHDRIPEVVTTYIKNHKVDRITIFGGENAVNGKVSSDLLKLIQ